MKVISKGEEIGQRVERLRSARGWSVRGLGERAKVSGSWVQLLESGGVAAPSHERLERVAAAFGVPLHDLTSDALEDQSIDVDTGVFVRMFRMLPVGGRQEVMTFMRFLEWSYQQSQVQIALVGSDKTVTRSKKAEVT